MTIRASESFIVGCSIITAPGLKQGLDCLLGAVFFVGEGFMPVQFLKRLLHRLLEIGVAVFVSA